MPASSSGGPGFDTLLQLPIPAFLLVHTLGLSGDGLQGSGSSHLHVLFGEWTSRWKALSLSLSPVKTTKLWQSTCQARASDLLRSKGFFPLDTALSCFCLPGPDHITWKWSMFPQGGWEGPLDLAVCLFSVRGYFLFVLLPQFLAQISRVKALIYK